MDFADIDLTDPELFQRGGHHEVFTFLRANDPLWFHPEPDEGGFWCVTKHADLQAVNRDFEAYSSNLGGVNIPNIPPEGEMVKSMMLYMDPPKHTRYRLLVNKGFTPRMIGQLEQSLALRTRAIVNRICERGTADFVDEAAGSLTRFLSQCFEHVAVNGHLASLRIRLDGKFALKCLDLLFCSCVDCPGASQQRFKLHAQRGGRGVWVAVGHEDEKRVSMLHRKANRGHRDVRAEQVGNHEAVVVQTNRLRHRIMQLH